MPSPQTQTAKEKERKRIDRERLLYDFNQKFGLTGGELAEKNGKLYIKLEDGKLKAFNRFVYEQYYGEIKDDELIIFLDWDNRNFNIENLMKVSVSQMRAIARRNQTNGNDLGICERMVTVIEFHDKLKSIRNCEDHK